jgi:hypothetical protein
MTTQEKINQLAKAALSAAPPSPSIPKPATFTPAPEKLREPTLEVRIPDAIATEAPVLPLLTGEEPAATEIVQHQSDPVLGKLLDEHEARMKKKLFRQRMCVNLLVVGFLAGTGVWYSNSARAQAEVKALVPAFRQSVKDFKMLGNLLGTFDKQLKKIGTHSTDIDEASKTMGIDPTKIAATDDIHMDKETAEFTRGEGKSTHQRDTLLQEKFGFVGKLAGDKGKLGQSKETAQQP